MNTLIFKIREGTLLSLFCTLLCFMLFDTRPGYAFFVEKRPITVQQPDGAELNIFASGDEYYHWLHDANNYTIVVDQKGYYVYAALQNGLLVPTVYRVGKTDPSAAGLQPGVNYSAEYLNKLREEKGAYRVQPSFLGTIQQKREASGDNARFGAATMNPLVIFIRFSGETEFTQTKTYYNGIFNTDANSMRNYYLWNSYNQLTITSQILGGTATTIASFQDSHARSYFQPYSASNTNGYTNANKWARERQLWLDAINALKANVPAGLDVDGNDDGWVDEIYFVIKGTNTGWGDILWPHAGGIGNNTITINGAKPNSFMCVFETWHDVGLLSHETGHVLGAPDFYRYSDNTINPLGNWETMASQTNPPQSMTAYTKWKYMGFINNIPEIKKSGYYTLSPLGTSPSAYKLPSTKAGEYFVVEYRSKTASSFESQIPGSGLLIYRVNSTASGNGGGPPDELYVYRPGGTNTTTNGNIFNAFYSSNAGRTALTDATSPNAFMSDNTLGRLNISEIGSAGGTITFYYKMPYCFAATTKTVIYNSSSVIPTLTEAIQLITNSGTVTIASGANVTFRSETVRLSTGFRANSGARFRATTPICPGYAAIPPLARILNEAQVAVNEDQEVDTNVPMTTEDPISFVAYPNPVSDHVKVDFSSNTTSVQAVEVYDATGVKIKSVEVNDLSSRLVIDLKNQIPGVYYLKAIAGGESSTKKIIIR